MASFKKRAKKKLNKRNIIIVCSILLLLTFTVTTFGRYIYRGIRNYYLSTKDFYFNCDKLDEDGNNYVLNNWSGVDPVPITFYLNSEKNNIVSSPNNIEYDIEYSCSDNVICNITKTSGTIFNTVHTDSFSVTLTPNRTLHNGDSVWVDVTVTSTSPYVKELSGKITINVSEVGLSYEIVDSPGSPYLDFNITNTTDYYKVIEAFDSYSVGDHIEISEYLALSNVNKEKCASAIITLTFGTALFRLDMTNQNYLDAISTSYSNIGTNRYISGLTFKMDALSSASVRFYKVNVNNDYSYPYVTSTPAITFNAS